MNAELLPLSKLLLCLLFVVHRNVVAVVVVVVATIVTRQIHYRLGLFTATLTLLLENVLFVV